MKVTVMALLAACVLSGCTDALPTASEVPPPGGGVPTPGNTSPAMVVAVLEDALHRSAPALIQGEESSGLGDALAALIAAIRVEAPGCGELLRTTRLAANRYTAQWGDDAELSVVHLALDYAEQLYGGS